MNSFFKLLVSLRHAHVIDTINLQQLAIANTHKEDLAAFHGLVDGRLVVIHDMMNTIGVCCVVYFVILFVVFVVFVVCVCVCMCERARARAEV